VRLNGRGVQSNVATSGAAWPAGGEGASDYRGNPFSGVAVVGLLC